MKNIFILLAVTRRRRFSPILPVKMNSFDAERGRRESEIVERKRDE